MLVVLFKKCKMRLHFFLESSKAWSLRCVRQLEGKGIPDYLALEPDCRSIYIVSEYSFNFISDTENPIVIEEEQEKTKKSKFGILIYIQ